MDRLVLWITLGLSIAGCRQPIDCGRYVFDEALQTCVCPPGTVEQRDGACLASDAGSSDAGDSDAGIAVDVGMLDTGASCAPETCNAADDDCNGIVDDGPAASSCNAVPHGTAGCSAGACYAAACTTGFDDCNHLVTDGCEADLATDFANCASCGSVCGWDCETTGCNDATDIAVGVNGTFRCAVRERGDAVCWGENASGQLGDGTTTPRVAPVAVLDLTDVIDVAAGGNHACAVEPTEAYGVGERTPSAS